MSEQVGDGAADLGSALVSLSHTVSYRSRFDECDARGALRSSGFMRWAQDAAWIHSEALGFTRQWYASRGLWWLVRCAELNVLGDVQMGETVSVTTSIVGYRKVWARRRTEISRASGGVVAIALTDWVMTDDRGLPTRVPDEFVQRFAGRADTFTPGRVLLPDTPPTAVRRGAVVRAGDTDPMAHVNNAAYIDYVDENIAGQGDDIWTKRLPRRYRLEYISPAALGEAIMIDTWPAAGGYDVRIERESGEDVLRSTVDSTTAHDDFRQAVALRRGARATGKDAGAG